MYTGTSLGFQDSEGGSLDLDTGLSDSKHRCLPRYPHSLLAYPCGLGQVIGALPPQLPCIVDRWVKPVSLNFNVYVTQVRAVLKVSILIREIWGRA